jgi:hypothetical protein
MTDDVKEFLAAMEDKTFGYGMCASTETFTFWTAVTQAGHRVTAMSQPALLAGMKDHARWATTDKAIHERA